MPGSSYQSQCRALRWGVYAVILALIAYIGWLQLAENEEMNHWSERQQKRLNYVPGKRGAIVDRNGVPLNYDIATYDIAIHIERLRDPRDTRKATINKVSAAVAELASMLGPDAYRTRPSARDINRHVDQSAPLPLILWKNPSEEMLARFALQRHRFPAADLVLSWKRVYTHETVATQIRGFGSQDKPASADSALRPFNFKEFVGQSGIELACNDKLRGTNGYQLFQTDVFTYWHETVETKKAMPGQDVALTIDVKLQQAAEEIFTSQGLKGALIVMDAVNGEVYVMASVPSHHLPLRTADLQPGSGAMRSRALAGYYPPGSTIKPLTALAGLENGIPDTKTYDCTGIAPHGYGSGIRCTARYGHGDLDMRHAIMKSCNVYFVELGVEVGIDALSRMFASAGIGTKTGIEIAERAGYLPKDGPKWNGPEAIKWFEKAVAKGETWAMGELGHCLLCGECAGKDVVRARSLLEKAVAANPGREDFAENLARARNEKE